jgi:Ca2+-binding RTX toxin-like protein
VRYTKLSMFAAGSLAIFTYISDADASFIDVSGVVRAGDFDGDDAFETVVSSPETDCGKGAVYVVTAAGALTTWSRDTTGVLGTAGCDYLFGASLAVGDFNDDGYDDLAIAAPGADDARPTASGSVHILYGSTTGLTETGDQLWTLDASGVEGTAEDADHFGDALAAGDFNCDGYDDLAIGSPRKSDGVVSVLYGSSGGLTSVDDLMLSGSGGKYGAALTAGNFDGDQALGIDCDDLVIAAPYATVSTETEAGSIYRFAGVTTGLAGTASQTIHQDVTGVLDTAQSTDYFGWRVAAARADTDAYDDLLVAVPGDACTSGVGTGRHLFHGSSSGITTTDNEISCDTYGCSVFDDHTLGCHSGSSAVYGTTTNEVIGLAPSNGLVWGGAGNDEVHGDHGNDLLFGGTGDDTIEGGPGRDMIIAGSGDDTIIIDLDCKVVEGEVVDGGPGSDTIRSHLTSTELATLGLTFVSIETFVLIDEDPRGPSACVAGSYDDGPFLRPMVSVAWTAFPTPDSVITSTTGLISMALTNISAETVEVELEFTLRVRGEELLLEHEPVTVASATTETITLDLNDFIPVGINPNNVNPALLVLPTAASITTRARLSIDDEHAGYSFPPTIFGHLGTGAITTAVLYREGALHDTYHHGDLARWRANAPAYSGAAKLMGRSEAHGSLGIPGY